MDVLLTVLHIDRHSHDFYRAPYYLNLKNPNNSAAKIQQSDVSSTDIDKNLLIYQQKI